MSKDIGYFPKKSKAVNITDIPHGPWNPLRIAPFMGGETKWYCQCIGCGFTPKNPISKQVLNRAKKREQKTCNMCPVIPLPQVPHIVELEPGLWLAPFKGDPGRTTVLACAKKFRDRKCANMALAMARKHRPFVDAEVLEAT